MRALLPRIIEVYAQQSPWSICKPTQRLFVAEAHFVPCQSTPFARRVGANRLPPDECALYGQLRCLRRAMFGLGGPRQPLRRHAARLGRCIDAQGALPSVTPRRVGAARPNAPPSKPCAGAVGDPDVRIAPATRRAKQERSGVCAPME